MTYWRGSARWINIALIVVLGVLVLDAVSRLLDGDGSSPPAALVQLLAAPARGPVVALVPGLPWPAVDGIAALLWTAVGLLLLVGVRSAELAVAPAEDAGGPAVAPAEDVAEETGPTAGPPYPP